jgi:diaminohydroxyphosphoribosylaminopyrimidine deaminase/5-amino-6-(5-phosphoribosylamino)uracil reductase
MRQALALAALGEGSTSPNPRVGCVVVRDGRAVATGFHRACGEPHAESRALDEAGERARGASLYVNLEPCAHFGRTPPCADRIVASGIARVVASIQDPDPRVNGLGFRRLRDGGVAVETGALEEDARRLNRSFLHWHETGRPWVVLKAGVSLDGMLAARDGRSRWITGAIARRFAQRLRMRHDAVLVGATTVRRDDPRLTVRVGGEERARLRVVLSSRADLDPGAAVFETRGGWPVTRIYAADDSGASPELRRRADVRVVPSHGGRLEVAAVLEDLARDAVQSVLVEGGGATWASFLSAGLADEAALFTAPLILGARGGTPLLDLASVDEPGHGWRLEDVRRIPLAEDVLVLGELRRSGPG